MRIVWHVDPEDVEKVRAFYEQHRRTPFVKKRIRDNLRDDKPPIAKEVFWERMVGCLLTTQQRSGPESAVTRFLLAVPFPLDYRTCSEQDDLVQFARMVISAFGGLRHHNRISAFLLANLSFLKGGGWEPTLEHLNVVRVDQTSAAERRAAEFIATSFEGFGTKQSRNLLQGLGLSRYEIPIDSRITKWLNNFGFPVRLTANALQDRNYYNFVSEGFQRLCAACDIAPCVLDAAIFASYDKGGWTEENVVW